MEACLVEEEVMFSWGSHMDFISCSITVLPMTVPTCGKFFNMMPSRISIFLDKQNFQISGATYTIIGVVCFWHFGSTLFGFSFYWLQ